ncbi:hypothetical protein Tco_0550729 [Tanacetum coccineum]
MVVECWKMTWDDVPIVPSDWRENGCQMRLNLVSIYRFLVVYSVTDSLVYAVTLLSCDLALTQSMKVVDFLFPWPLELTGQNTRAHFLRYLRNISSSASFLHIILSRAFDSVNCLDLQIKLSLVLPSIDVNAARYVFVLPMAVTTASLIFEDGS